jgi:hypothetical protein
MGSAELPQCLSVIICDDIYRDEDTKKLIIVGTFNTIHPHRFPWTHPKMCVLFTLTNGRGEYRMSLSVEHARSGVEIARISGPLKMTQPLAISDFNVVFQNLPFTTDGKYWVSVKVDDTIIMQRPFVVMALPDEKAENTEASHD